MPVDAGSIAAAAGSIMPSPKDFFNVGSTLYANYKSRKFSEKMYQRQYDDALAFWDKQNEYNTPANQMQRFKDAGLNPNLVYGQGNSGPAGAIPVPDVQSVNFREPRVEGNGNAAMSALLAQADLRIKAAQADNLEVQNQVIRQDAIVRGLQGERLQFDLGFDRDLRETSADYKREQLRGLTNSIDLAINRDAREAVRLSSNVKEAAERMLTMQQNRQHSRIDIQQMQHRIQLMEKEGITRDIENNLRRMNINPNDPMWSRIVGQFLSDTLGSGRPSDVISKGMNSTGVNLWQFLIDPTKVYLLGGKK